jgi:hypothetical protein
VTIEHSLTEETLSSLWSLIQCPSDKVSEETLSRAMHWPMGTPPAYFTTSRPYLKRTDLNFSTKLPSPIQRKNTSLPAVPVTRTSQCRVQAKLRQATASKVDERSNGLLHETVCAPEFKFFLFIATPDRTPYFGIHLLPLFAEDRAEDTIVHSRRSACGEFCRITCTDRL